MSLYFLGGVPIQYFGLDPIDPRSSLIFNLNEATKQLGYIFCKINPTDKLRV